MAIEDSINFVLEVNPGAGYVVVEGQADTRLDMSAREYDTSNKATGGWATALGGRSRFRITARGFVNWPADALTYIQTQKVAGEDVDARVVLNSDGDTATCLCRCTTFEYDAPNENATQWSVELVGTEEPTFA